MSILEKLKNLFSGKDKLDVNAKDGDKDGIVQEGTVFERSVDLTVEGAKVKAKKVAKKAAADAADVVAKAATELSAELKKPAAKKPAAKKPATPAKKPSASKGNGGTAKKAK